MYSCFGEHKSINIELMEKLYQFFIKDVFNIDKTWFFYRLQPDHSLVTNQLNGKK